MYLKLNIILSSGISCLSVLFLFLFCSSFKNKKDLPVSQEEKQTGQTLSGKKSSRQNLLAGNLFKQIAVLFRIGPGIFIMARTAGIKAERHQPTS